MQKKIKTLSLFTGAGGLDIGFHQAGYDIRGCVEIEPAYCATLAANNGSSGWFESDVEIHCKSVEDFDPRPYKDASIECVIGGPPCQTFSAAGRRAGGVIGTADSRGRLFQRYSEIIEAIQPAAFVFENVYGLPGANGGEPWRDILRTFSRLGYTLSYDILDSADYGVAQHRERLFLVGTRAKKFQFPVPTHGPDSLDGLPLVSVRDVIEDLQDPGEPFHDGLGGLYGHLLPLVPNGLNYSFFTAEMGHPEPQFAWRSKFHDLLYKVDPAAPSRTIKASPGKFTGPFHWKNRHFTTAEFKRIQSFPDEYKIVGSDSRILEQIGNSVPPRLAYTVALSLREQIFDSRGTIKLPLRPEGFVSTFRQRQRERTKKFKVIAAEAIRQQYPRHDNHAATVVSFKDEDYFLLTEGHFRSVKHHSHVPPSNVDQVVYKVSVRENSDSISVEFKRLGCREGSLLQGHVDIRGLKKYMGRIDAVKVETALQDIKDVFHVWSVIERELVERSRFFSLIDIYGHYANRGDTVKVAADYGLSESSPAVRLLNFVSKSEISGGFIDRGYLMQRLSITDKQFNSAVLTLRNERFDVRTKDTHPIIKNGTTICTYPFPLLSARALVISRADVTDDGFDARANLPLAIGSRAS